MTPSGEPSQASTLVDPFAHYEDRRRQITLRTDARLISHSEVATFKRCRRKWWLAWYRGLRLRSESPTGVRAIGDRVHRALAEWYVSDSTLRVDPREALAKLTHSDTEQVSMKFSDSENLADILLQMKKDADLEMAMIEGYVQWLEESGADANLEVLASEQYREAHFPALAGRAGAPVYIIAKLDARIRRRTDGVVLYMDHKTVADFASKSLNLVLDEQMLWYDLIEIINLTPLGERSGGALYNMMRRVKRTVKAKPPFFQRLEVLHNKHQITSFYHQLYGVLQDILRLENQLDLGADHQQVAYPTPNGNCSWDCDYRVICPLFNDGSRVESMVKSLYVEGDPLSYYYKDEVKEDR